MRVAQNPTSSRRWSGRGQVGWAAVLTLIAAPVVVGVRPWPTTGPATVHAAPTGMASVTGQVTAPSPFKAARVYLRNTDKKVLHMVYTQGGRFRATPLFPGAYEIRVIANGLVSEVQQLA